MKTPREVVQDWVTAYNRRDAYAAPLAKEDRCLQSMGPIILNAAIGSAKFSL
jgi:hypothetical protein